MNSRPSSESGFANCLHRSVVLGKLSEFAGIQKNWAHIQAERELRSGEYDSKKTDSKLRIWAVKVRF